MDIPKISSVSPDRTAILLFLALITACSCYSVYTIFTLYRKVDIRALVPSPMVIKKTKVATMIIDVEGAVEKPGIYEVPITTRFVEALLVAEGLSKNADRYYVAKTFNLAKKLLDEDKIYIPFNNERGSLADSSAHQLISINTASQTELELLPKIGPTTAGKIMEHRPYGSTEELVSKRVIGQKTFESIQELITR